MKSFLLQLLLVGKKGILGLGRGEITFQKIQFCLDLCLLSLSPAADSPQYKGPSVVVNQIAYAFNT